jgi:hypothetical protein
MVDEIPGLSPELREAAMQIPVVIGCFYASVFTSFNQLLQTLIEAAEREGFRPVR